MGSPIDELIEKYWNGETSLEEEQMVKDHFKQNPKISSESDYFRSLENQKSISYKPKSFKIQKTWVSVAATVVVGILTAIFVINDAKKDPFAIKDPQEALDATRKVLLLIGSEMNEGQNHAAEFSKFDEMKEQLEKEEI